MENYIAAGNPSINVNLGVHRSAQNAKSASSSADDDTALVADMYAEAPLVVGETIEEGLIDYIVDAMPADAPSGSKSRRARSEGSDATPEILSRGKAQEVMLPRPDMRSGSAPEYMHLWASIENHLTQITSQTAVLNAVTATKPPFVLGITSAVVGEGKTTVAMNLAQSAARNTWYRVCLVDLGLDGDEISLRHGIESDGTGIIALLEEDNSTHFSSQALPTFNLEDHGGLTVLPAGKLPDNAARVARSPHLSSLLECLRDKFDLIIVDLPAVSTDNALPITAAMDGIVLVARAGATPAGVIGDAVNKIGREAVIGVVLN